MRIDAAGYVDTLHLGSILRIADNGFNGHGARLQDALIVIHVLNKQVECAGALLETRFQLLPFMGRQDSRHDIKRDESLGSFLFAVDGECDAKAMKERVGLGALLLQP